MSDPRSPTSFHPALTSPNNLPLPSIDEASQLIHSKNANAPPCAPAKNGLNASGGIGDNLLREYAHQLGPLNTAHTYDIDNDPSESSFSAATTVGQNSPNDSASSLPSSPMFPSRPSKSTYIHRKNALSVESIPRQTIIKALASAGRSHNPHNLSLSGMISAQNQMENRPGTATSQRLSAALSDLAIRNGTPTTPRFNALQSPCFYHERFDDVLNIDKVLEEIRESGSSMTHSRLLATATGVREISKQLQRRPIKRAVRNVMIVTKARDNQLVHLTRELATWLMSTPRYGSELGVNVYVDAKLQKSKRFGSEALLEEHPRFQNLLKYWKPEMCRNQPEKFDLVLTLGGDGTVLFTSWLFQGIVPPILSFSLGSLGFLTNFEYDKFKDQLNKVMGEDGMRVSMRMRFTCTVYKAHGQDMEEAEQFEVLNELVIDRGPSPYVSNLELYGDNELLTVVQADGCIFATPTGSTAYSLSAGGSLVHPDIPAILLTPICPHTLSFRPMVLSDTMLLRVSIPRNSRATAYCSFDGKNRVELRQGDHITIAASQYPFPTVMKSGAEWFESVSTSLKWNTRGAAQKGWDGLEENQEQETEWDIDFDDSAYGTSEENSTATSPRKASSIDM